MELLVVIGPVVRSKSLQLSSMTKPTGVTTGACTVTLATAEVAELPLQLTLTMQRYRQQHLRSRPVLTKFCE